MAKTIIEDLLSLVSPEEATAIRAKIDANPGLAVRDRKQSELFGIYTGEDEPTTTVIAAPVAAAAHTPTVPSAATTTAAPATTTTTTGADANAQILAELTGIKTSLDTRFKELETKFVPAADLAKHRTELLSLAIKTADDINQIRHNHRTLTGKELDRAAFEKFVDEAKLPNGAPRFANLVEAHEAFTAADRTKAEIAKGVEEGVKQRTSAQTVPGQTQTTAMSPAQQVMAKARQSGSGEGKTAAMAAADRLAAIVRARDEGTSASA